MTAVLATPDGFLAGGSAGPELGERRACFWRSADGTTWEAVPDAAALDGAEVTALAALPGGGYAAVGIAGPPSDARASVAWVSGDGWTWRRVAELADTRAVALTAAPDGSLVAVGSDLDERAAVVWRSVDGGSWERVPPEASRDFGGRKIRMTDVTASGDGWLVAVGNRVGLQFGTATTWRSRDGRHWERSTNAPALEQGEMYAVTIDGERLVAVGTFGAPDDYVPRVWLSQGR